VRSRLAAAIVISTVAPLAMPDVAAAQGRPRPAAEVAVGWVGFADDGIVSESLVGAAGRWYLSPRIGIGPEIVYISGNRHSHLVITGNLTWDCFAPANAQRRGFTPFLVAGGGVFQTRESFVRGTFTSHDGAFTAGGGIRALIGDRIIVGLDARVGWEPHVRINGTIGVQLGR
jgi:hypothetical protein